MSKCACCKNESTLSIQLVEWSGRYYIPNQNVRNASTGDIKDIWFCKKCMRSIEDNLRATILYLQHENKK